MEKVIINAVVALAVLSAVVTPVPPRTPKPVVVEQPIYFILQSGYE